MFFRFLSGDKKNVDRVLGWKPAPVPLSYWILSEVPPPPRIAVEKVFLTITIVISPWLRLVIIPLPRQRLCFLCLGEQGLHGFTLNSHDMKPDLTAPKNSGKPMMLLLKAWRWSLQLPGWTQKFFSYQLCKNVYPFVGQHLYMKCCFF